MILNADISIGSSSRSESSNGFAAGGGIYLKSISTTGITVNAIGCNSGTTSNGYATVSLKGTIDFSYQIIEFM